MATLKLFILALVCLTASGLPNPPVTRNTIFMDEKLEGEIFEHVDDFNNIEYNLPPESYRLPTTTRPLHYNLLWAIEIERFAFFGSVNIQLRPTQANVSEIVIHSHDIIHNQITLRRSDNNQILNHTTTVDEERQFLTISLTSGFLEFDPSINYTLSINFEAPLRNDMYGIYRSWYKNNQTATNVSWMASTQFQATSARFAFPCYDEPGFKARFDIVIRRPVSFTSWSCTRLRQTIASPTVDYQDDVYETTPIMSTYLLALVVAADYNNTVPVTSANGTLMYEVIARQAAIAEGQGAYAMDAGRRLVERMNVYTDIEYFDMDTNLKMTHAAIPDFSAGAMENWGLITYREAYLMYNPEHTNDYYKQLIAYILSHEIAHMWFGNLVTCDYWYNLWLNEGFARYYQYFLTHWVEDYMGFETRFINEQVHTSLLFDSAETAHPLTNPNIGNPSSIRTMFSTISYNKGAAVIRMTEHLLGSEVNIQGLRNLLVQRSYDVVRPIDLFQALDAAGRAAGSFSEYASDFSFIDYYRSWTEQSGHPILNVQVDHQTGDMKITQRRFSINTGYATQNLNYIIPITFATASDPDFDNTKPSHIISSSVSTINRNSTGDQWVIFNKQQTGFYRVNYDDYTWNLIIVALRGSDRTLIHEYNRAQIVDDVFQFSRAGLMSYNRAFNILSFLENETEYSPWVAAITGFNWIRNRLAGSDYLPRLEAQIIRWASNVMSQLTYYPIENESFMRSYLRYQLAPLMCNLGVPACLQAASQQFNALRSGTEVPNNSRNWVYCYGLRQGTQSDFDFLFNRYLEHNTYNEKILILQTLGCTPHQESLNRLLDNIIEENFVIRPQDYSVAYNGALNGGPENPSRVLNYIRTNVANIINAFGSASPITSAISRLSSETAINEVLTWANQNQATLGNYYQTVVSSCESTRQGLLWVNTVADQLDDYFTTGDVVVTPSSVTVPPVTPPVTVTPSTLVPPSTPNLPDSAVTSVLSIAVLVLAFAINIIV